MHVRENEWIVSSSSDDWFYYGILHYYLCKKWGIQFIHALFDCYYFICMSGFSFSGKIQLLHELLQDIYSWFCTIVCLHVTEVYVNLACRYILHSTHTHSEMLCFSTFPGRVKKTIKSVRVMVSIRHFFSRSLYLNFLPKNYNFSISNCTFFPDFRAFCVI